MSPGDPKPLDAGTGRVCASFDRRTAAWLSLGIPHERHGFVELSALPPWNEGHRGDPVATRRHRLEMTQGEHAFLSVEIDGQRAVLVPDVSDAERPSWWGGSVEVRVGVETDAAVVRQEWLVGGGSGPRRAIAVRLRGRIDRPALAEITETDPPAATGAGTEMTTDGPSVRLDAPALPATARVGITGAAVSWRRDGGELVGTLLTDAASGAVRFGLAVEFVSPSAIGPAGPTAAPAGSRVRLVERALAYVRGCTALRVAPRERTILTDHRILPLSWTRDAYWQALALLAADGPGDRERVADHLRWLWTRCERPDGRWVRSHHANGRRKDRAFQSDQQLYPLVELADYWRTCRSLPDGVAWEVEIERAWRASETAIEPATGLIASTENAADDPAAAPFIASSQILRWYAARRIAELARPDGLRLDAERFDAAAASAHAAFGAAFVSGVQPWPYAVDGAGARVVYHDANDLPVALAPAWGFCRPADAGWRATMAFAFGRDNPAWFDGDRPGLGSLHTAAPWTLGDLQAWLYGRAVGDRRIVERAERRLETAAFADGMLPEAYSTDGDERIRHWFAWPGAALAAFRLLDAGGGLERRLAADPPSRNDP